MNIYEAQDFKKQRQINTLNIRKEKRQQNFQKKRQFNYDSELNMNNTQYQESLTIKSKNIILDQQRKQLIETAIQKKYFPNMFPDLVAKLYSNDINEKHQGLIGIRKIVSSSDQPPIHLVFDYEILDYIITLLKQDIFLHLRLQAIWVISNIASSNQRQHIQSLMQKDFIPYLISFILENKHGIVDQAIWAIGNISGDSPKNRDILIEYNVVPAIIHLTNETKNKNILSQAVWALSNICRGTPLPPYEKIKQATPIFCKAIQMKILDLQNLSDALWALSYLLEGPKSRLDTIPNQQIFSQLIQLSKNPYINVSIPTLRILGTISTGNQHYTQLLLKHGILNTFQILVDHQKSVIRRQICWIFSNIAAGNKNQINQILQKNILIQKVLNLFEFDSQQVKRQICYIFANMTYLGDRQKLTQLIIKKQILRLYANIIIQQSNNKLVQNCLDTLPLLFDFGQNIKKFHSNKNIIIEHLFSYPSFKQSFENLQHHENQKIYFKTVKILKNYFDLQDESSKQMDTQF